MSAPVTNIIPGLDTDGLLSGLPVSAADWAQLANLANWLRGHGAMLVPQAHVGLAVEEGTSRTLRFYVAPKLPAVERVWLVALRASAAGMTATITVPSGATTVAVSDSREPATVVAIRDPLTAKTETAGEVSITVAAAGLQSTEIVVESIAMYEQSRASVEQDSTDLGVDTASTRTRDPIIETSYRSVHGVAESSKAMDARRAGLFHWPTSTDDAVTITSTTYVGLFPFTAPMAAAIPTPGDTAATVTVAVYARVDTGEGAVRFASDSAGDSVVLSITGTAYSWVTGTLEIDTENFAVADGRRFNVWEAVEVAAIVETGTTLSIAGISIIRTTKPV